MEDAKVRMVIVPNYISEEIDRKVTAWVETHPDAPVDQIRSDLLRCVDLYGVVGDIAEPEAADDPTP